MTYRPSANEPATAWARHLDAVMRERGWSRVRLFEEVGAELGYAPKSRSGFLPLLADREPTPAQADVLRRHFGEPAAIPEPESGKHTPDSGSIAELVAELRMQNALMATALGLLSQDVKMSPQARRAMDDFLEQAKAQSTSRLPALHPAG